MDYGVQETNFGAQYGYNNNYGSVDSIGDRTGVNHDSSSSAGKLFVGGIAWETSQESFTRYFRKYGEIIDSIIMMDRLTGKPRGFGFVTFADEEIADKVLQENHIIDGRTVEIKKTLPREDTQVRGVSKTKKIFVGGLPVSLSEDEMREYFSSYGNVVEQQIMLDRETGRSRGFGFVTFDTEDAVDKIFFDGQMHELGGKKVEIKRAEPKRPGFDHSAGNQPRHGVYGGRMRNFGNSKSYDLSSGSEDFTGGNGGKMGGRGGYGGGYGGYAGYGNFAGNHTGGVAGFYPGYGGYGYGYGYGGPMYGGGGFGASFGYGGAAGYGLGKGYGGADDGFDDGKGFSSGGGESYGPRRGYGDGSDGYGTGKGYFNESAMNGRFHPYRK